MPRALQGRLARRAADVEHLQFPDVYGASFADFQTCADNVVPLERTGRTSSLEEPSQLQPSVYLLHSYIEGCQAELTAHASYA